MSMDFRKTTYRPTRTDNRFRTSYSLMSQWMNRKGSGQAYRKEPLPQTFAIAMQGNAAFPRQPALSAGSRSMEDLRGHGEQYGPDPMLYNVTAPQACIDETVPVHLRYNDTAGYDDFHKSFNQVSKQWPSASYPDFGPARLRHGRAGGSWRHVKEVLQAGGARIVFVDGVIRWADGVKMDEIPGGNLIQPKVGQIKSRYITPTQQARPSATQVNISQQQGVSNVHHAPVFARSRTDMPASSFRETGRQKSGL